jgi:hypothetical protein
MLFFYLALFASLFLPAVFAQVNNIFCQARYITNIATCIVGVKECNTLERFSACVCFNTGNKPAIRNCVLSLLSDDSFTGTLLPNDVSLASIDISVRCCASLHIFKFSSPICDAFLDQSTENQRVTGGVKNSYLAR